MPGWMMLCLDASFLFNLITRRLTSEHAALWERWVVEQRPMIAPLLMRYEIANTLNKWRRKAAIDEQTVQRGMSDIVALPIRFLDDDRLPFEALALARDLDLSATYDAHYVALAARYGADLWTSDHRLWVKTHPQFDWVHYAPERLPAT